MDNITKNNKLIAEFMGDSLYMLFPGSFKYHKSWDWLMPVVDKIDKLVPNGRTFIEYTEDLWWVNLDKAWAESRVSKIDATYKAVVEFIKWYNKEKVK